MPLFRSGARLGHDLYIDIGDQRTNTDLFEQLLESRDAIEAAYGSPLQWLELPDRRACRIADETDGSVEQDARHDEFISWLIDRGERLRQALTPEMFATHRGPRSASTGESQVTGPASDQQRYADLLRAASPATQAIEPLLLAWAKLRNLDVRMTPKALQILSQNGLGICQFFPGYGAVEFPLADLRNRADSGKFAAVEEQMQMISTSRKLAPKNPNVLCEDLARDWVGATEPWLDSWLELLEATGPSGFTPFSYGGR